MPRQGVSAFCKANGPSCTSRDLRRTLATMMIAGGYDMRAAVSCLGHTTVSMALNIYADVGPDAKRATVSTEQDCLDVDMAASPIECDLFGNEPDLQPVAPHFHIDQFEAMLTQA
ncbi:MAG: tyrosine-type recombinase/integrase [Olsenella sp.]